MRRPASSSCCAGPSGSGKTTILRAMAGLDPFDEGTIEVGEARLEGGRAPRAATMLHRLRRSVGFVFQFHCLFEHLTALQNVCLAPVHVARRPRAMRSERARELLARAGRGGEGRRAAAAALGRRSAAGGDRARAGGGSAGAADGRADGIARSVAPRRAGRVVAASHRRRAHAAGDEPRRNVARISSRRGS